MSPEQSQQLSSDCAETFQMICCFQNVFIYTFCIGNVSVIAENENKYCFLEVAKNVLFKKF